MRANAWEWIREGVSSHDVSSRDVRIVCPRLKHTLTRGDTIHVHHKLPGATYLR